MDLPSDAEEAHFEIMTNDHTSSAPDDSARPSAALADAASADLQTQLQLQALDHETHMRLLAELQDFVRLTLSTLLFSQSAERGSSAEQDVVPTASTAGTSLHARVGPLLERLLFAVGQVYSSHPLTQRVAETTQDCLRSMVELTQVFLSDIRAALQHDPAASDPLVVALCYPGFHATAHYRLAHILHTNDIPLLPRMLTEVAHRETGIDIHPGAKIGSSFFIDHGTGVVIGETAVIGSGVTLYQGVTLGAKHFVRDANGTVVRGLPRHPVLEEGVTVYAGATILGRITVGARSVIGGNVWLTNSVAPGSRITQQPCVSSYFDHGEGI
jgi:serine O-acetyltransferase